MTCKHETKVVYVNTIESCGLKFYECEISGKRCEKKKCPNFERAFGSDGYVIRKLKKEKKI